MREALQGAEDPMDHNVESVLPGVHTRLATMQNEISGVRGDMQRVASHFGEVSTSLNDVKGLLEGRDTELAAHLLQLASRLCPNCPEPRSSPPMLAIMPTADAATLPEQAMMLEASDSAGMVMPTGHHLRAKHSTIYTLYHEWFGLEDFGGIPVSGGIDFCERQWKSKWRPHFNAAEKQHFSRVKAIILAIEAKQERESVEVEVALDEFEAIFGGSEVKKSTANMAKWLKQGENGGYVSKKKRRGRQTA
jgi:hypothetical protein